MRLINRKTNGSGQVAERTMDMTERKAKSRQHKGFLLGIFMIPSLLFQPVSTMMPHIYVNAADGGGRTIYVSETGNDFTGNGSSESPYRSIRKAAGEATAGTTVLIRPGTYIEDDIRPK